eukprot:m.821485 g.821485  ORF g.821485 m.821485 type:complete len:121 (-) comp23400_c0_seq5:226-588(-)
MENRHANTIPVHADVCPADYCDVFGCDCSQPCNEHRLRQARINCRQLVEQCSTNFTQIEMIDRMHCQRSLSCGVYHRGCLDEESSSTLLYLVLFAVFVAVVAVCSCVGCRPNADGHLHRD